MAYLDPNDSIDPMIIDEGFAGGGHGYGGGGGGFTGPFIPTFGQGGQAGDFGGFGPAAAWSQFRRRIPGRFGAQASPFRLPGGASTPPIAQGMGGGGPQAGAGIIPLPNQSTMPTGHPGWFTLPGAPGLPPGSPRGNRPGANPDNPDWWSGKFGPIQHVNDIIAALILQAGSGGAFGLEPPAALMKSIRGRAVRDAGAQERAARLGLQSRGDTDPSTYGFQSLLSQVQGQRSVADQLGNADVALRAQQLQFLQDLLKQYYGGETGIRGAEASRPEQGSSWLDLVPGIGSLIGGIRGGRR